MGHILSDITKKLIIDRFITGLQLITTNSNDLFFYKACIYTKSTQKPIPKIHKEKQAEDFGNKIYSNLWGPISVNI